MYRAVLIDVVHFTFSKEDAAVRLAELEELVKTHGGVSVVKVIQRRAQPDHQTYIGKGKVEELKTMAQELEANVIIVNEILKPRQVFALQEAMRDPVKKNGVAVWDRIDLILQIFDAHAMSAEAKLQIALARLRHMGPRIFGMGQQLGRQRGGTGTRGGAGEGNTEQMKRHLKEQERQILHKIARCENMRAQQRQSRSRQGYATVALVGYTNAGKTSLFNVLTSRHAYAADKLFATLDTRVGELFLPDTSRKALLSDTIGFIDNLPPSLIQAFRSTLSEAVHADLLLHVVDASDVRFPEKMKVVEGILADLALTDRPTIIVLNKIDLGPQRGLPKKNAVRVSAQTGEGIDRVLEKISATLAL
jgi:GTP-binding protein HflX